MLFKDRNVYSVMKTLQPAIDWIRDNLDEILELVKAIALGFLAWKVTNEIMGLVDAIKNKSLNKIAMGVTLMVTGFTLEFSGAYDIGYGDATFWDYAKTAIGAALGVGGALLVFGTTPVGWAVGIGLALTVLITGISIGRWNRAKDDDLADRFGDYVLSDTELADWVESLTTTELSVKIGLFIDEQDNLSSLKTQVEAAITKLNGYNFRLSLGLEVTQEDYQSAVDALISSAEEYLQEKQIVAALAVDIVYDGSSTGDRLTEFVNSFYSTSYLQLSDLGAELKQVVSDGFVDGVWIDDKLSEAIALQEEIQEILDYISTVEFDAKLTALKLDASECDITPESFTTLLGQAQDTIQEQVENLEGVRLEALKIAKMEFDQNILNGMSESVAQEIYTSAVISPIQVLFDTAMLNVSGFFSTAWTTISTLWSTVRSWFDTNVITPVKTAFDTGLTAIKNFFSTAWTGIKGVWSTVKGWFDTTVISPVRTAFSGMIDNVKGFFSTLWTDVQGVWSGAGTWFQTNVVDAISRVLKGLVNGAIGLFEGMLNGIINAINWVIDKVNVVLTAFGGSGIERLSTVSIPRLAEGGFVDEGQLFIAREAGAEMVGAIGRRTTVANNAQIVDGIRAGVADANGDVVAAIYTLIGAVQDKDMNVSIGDEQVGRSYDRYNSKRGIRVNSGAFANAY